MSANNMQERLDLQHMETIKTSESDPHFVIGFSNQKYYIVSRTMSSQTDDVFYINGKPARLVFPFRVVPKKQEEVNELANLELLAGQAVNRVQAAAAAAAATAAALATVQQRTPWLIEGTESCHVLMKVLEPPLAEMAERFVDHETVEVGVQVVRIPLDVRLRYSRGIQTGLGPFD